MIWMYADFVIFRPLQYKKDGAEAGLGGLCSHRESKRRRETATLEPQCRADDAADLRYATGARPKGIQTTRVGV